MTQNGTDAGIAPVEDESLKKAKFVGEEEVGKRSSPRKDLLGAVVIGALAVLAIVLAWQMPRMQSIYTAPGLLPFFTGVTLLCMAVALGLKAKRDGGLKELLAPQDRSEEEAFTSRRTLLLGLIIFIYVVLVDLITFDLRFPTSFWTFRFSSFEFVSIPALAFVLRMFWKAPIWRCLLVSTIFIIILAEIFRSGFHILLPGSN